MGKAIYDNLLLLKDAGAVVATGAGTVNAVARVIDVGDAAIGQAKMVIDTSAIDTVTGDESYRVALQGSNVINFASGVVELASTLVASSGRTEVPVSNERGGVNYRYLRVMQTLAGTTPSLNATVFLTKA